MRRFLDRFSGTHFTIIAVAALFAPSALYGVTAFTNVAVEDPANGNRAKINSSGQVYTYDPVADPLAAYARDPRNFVQVYMNLNSNCDLNNAYTPPAGKALVITNVGGFYFKSPKTAEYAGFALNFNANCTGDTIVYPLTDQYIMPVSESLGNGAVVAAGQSINADGVNNGGAIVIRGYLIPASAVPAAGSAEAKAMYVSHSRTTFRPGVR